jgi:hypothetical protein
MRSVLRDWVMELPLREQGTLIVATRGCDVAPKFPLDSPERRVTAAIRYAIMIPHDEREVDSTPGCFMLSTPPMDLKLSMLEHYPQHWVGHIIHACEVIAYRHPNRDYAGYWMVLYWQLCRSLHMNDETKEQMVARLSEDRVATGTVVSL